MAEEKEQQLEKAVFGRNEILAGLGKTTVKKVYSKELDGHVYMKELSAADQDSYDRSLVEFTEDEKTGDIKTEQRMENMRAKYLVRVLCDEKGNRLFAHEDAEELGQRRAGVLRELYNLALEVNGASRAAVEEQEKNSKAGQTEDSPSA